MVNQILVSQMYVYEPIDVLGSTSSDYFHYHEVAYMDFMIKNPRQTLMHIREYLGPFDNAGNQVITDCLRLVLGSNTEKGKGLWESRVNRLG